VYLGEKAGEALLRLWAADSSGAMPCPIPGHDGVGRLVRDDAQELRLRCCRGRWRSIGEVRAARAYGEDRQRTNIEIATWLRRLAHELGVFKFEPVPLPELTADGTPQAHRAREGFALLIGLRWADGPHRPVPFSVRFCAAWCSLPIRAANEAIRELLEQGVLWHENAGEQSRLRLYLPGEVEEEVGPSERMEAFVRRFHTMFPGSYEEAAA
jgi:hypothetical protein